MSTQLVVSNKEEIDNFLWKHAHDFFHEVNAEKGMPPGIAATYSDGTPIEGLVNVAWVCECGARCQIQYEIGEKK